MRSHRTGRSIGTMITRAMLGAMLLAISGTGAILAAEPDEVGAFASVEFWRALIILTAAVIATLAVALAPRRSTPIRVRRDDRAD